MMRRADGFLMDQVMPAFIAKMRHIDPGSGVIGDKTQHLTGGQSHEAFACLKNRQRTEQAQRVKIMVKFHKVRI